MTIATTSQKPKRVTRPKYLRQGIDSPMTYDEYMAGPEEMRRYDIIDGYQRYRLYGAAQLPNPTREHNGIIGNLMLAFRGFERSAQTAEVIIAPCDILITRSPLHTRQPDVSLISKERLTRNPPPDNPAPLDPAPELVVEIVYPFDHISMLAAKISDYRAVAVREIWVA